MTAMPVQQGGSWFDKLGGILMPTDPSAAAQIDPAALQQMQRQALLQTGLGMLAGKERGMGFGNAALTGLGAGMNTYNNVLQSSFQNAMETKRTKQREEIAKRADQWEQLKYKTDRADRQSDLDRETTRWEADQKRQDAADRLKASEVASGNAYRGSGAASNQADAALKAQTTAFLQTTKARYDALTAKAQNAMGIPLTPAEQQELVNAENILSGGSPQGLIGAQSRGFGLGMGMGMDPMMFPGGAGGGTGNPILDSGFTGLE